MGERLGSSFEAPVSATETQHHIEPGWYYSGEDQDYKGAGERPTIGGIASGKGNHENGIPIISVNPDGTGIEYHRLVDNDAVQEGSIPWHQEEILGPVSEHIRGEQH